MDDALASVGSRGQSVVEIAGRTWAADHPCAFPERCTGAAAKTGAKA